MYLRPFTPHMLSSVDIEASCLAICERELQNTYQNVQLLFIVLWIPLPLWCLPISASPAPHRGTIHCKTFDKSVDLFVPQLSIWEWGESYTACSQDPWQLYPVMIQRLHQPLIFPGVVFNALLNIVESHWNGNFKMRLAMISVFGPLSWVLNRHKDCFSGSEGVIVRSPRHLRN